MAYIPSVAWTTEPKPNLGTQMLLQAINTQPVQGDARIVSLGTERPLVTSALLDAMIAAETEKCKISFPFKYMVTAFINRCTTWEAKLARTGVDIDRSGRVNTDMEGAQSKTGDWRPYNPD
jgi:hypothetical protein